MAPELAKAREAIDKLASEIPQDPTTLVMAERAADNPRPTFVHNRGEFLQPKERVRARGAFDAAGDGARTFLATGSGWRAGSSQDQTRLPAASR